jgi:hypothetical protein
MTNLGRNDPCHCGSGKKYKKCHLDADQRSRAAMRQLDANLNGDGESPSASVDFTRLPNLFRQFSNRGPAKDRKEFAKIAATAESLSKYMARREEIEAAGAELEAHRPEFEKLVRDEDRCAALGQAVFAEECFAPLRFTASDVQRAFDHVGHPALMSSDEQTVKILRAAILHLADKERRSLLSMGLLARLPDFVQAGRYLEGWLVQSAAINTAENDGESNAFLFHMFSAGYDAWAAGKRAQDEALLRKMGVDPDRMRGMDLDEVDSWIESQAADPAKKGVIEAFFQDNPHLREESVANLQAMERNSTKLLEHEDCRFLDLPSEEVQPWLVLFSERFNQSGLLPETLTDASGECVREMFKELAFPLMREMAEAIFTRDRILQLVAGLKKYRSDRFTAGDKVAAGQAMGAINYLEREDSPGQNRFLLTLCWRSLGSAIKANTVGDSETAEERGNASAPR